MDLLLPLLIEETSELMEGEHFAEVTELLLRLEF